MEENEATAVPPEGEPAPDATPQEEGSAVPEEGPQPGRKEVAIEEPERYADEEDDLTITERKIAEVARTLSQKMSSIRKMSFTDGERVEVDKTALEAILDVSSRIAGIQRRSRLSMSTLALSHESYKDKQAKAKEARNNRMGGLKQQHRYLLENCALLLNRPNEYVLEGVYDADIHIELLDSAIAEGGRNCIVLCDALLPPCKMESGRFVPNQRGKMERTYLSDASTIGTEGKCVAMYRFKTKAIDAKNVVDDYFFVVFDVNPETNNVVSAIYHTMRRVYIPALKTCQGWEDINPPNPNSQTIINTYISKIMLFVDYLAKTKIDLDCCTRFKINYALYEDELADEEKMKLAITKTHVLEEICTYVKQWIRQITMVLVQSQQLRREPSNIGPLAELDHWRRQLTTFTSIIEHIKSEPTQILYNFYRECYAETQKEMMEAADERPFDCSEMYIFGKFETFRIRLTKVIDLFQTYITYYVLNKTTLEGIEEYASNFNKLFKNISSKTYDALDHRYNEEKEQPELPRNMPPVSGRIMWIRFYNKTINYPMDVFKQHHEVITHMNTQRCIKLYNVLSIVFTEFELIYHHAWAENVGQVRLGLIAPLLIRHPVTNMYLINFSIYIPECIREVEYMWQLGLSVPDGAQIVAFCKDKIFGNYERIKHLVDRNNQIRRSMPKLYQPLLRAQLIKLENAFQPGLSTITWTSLEIPSYCENIERVLTEVDLFVKEVVDMKEARIDAILKSITKTVLVYLPEEAVDPAVFYEENLLRRDEIAMEIQQKSWNAEIAVIELVHKFLDSVPSKAIQDLKNKWSVYKLVVVSSTKQHFMY
ncbi:hypothetical protein HF086_003912 [Spodoptera exigua]|uniref:Dynein heavy chain tail domain-containing protein n=1 Tax=Spodoptera exigua TaxID=7107 RepID=A0A922MR75_SPOEX|nr:hypothetical protein HF086_003912 [Spodoptera exigua]